MRLMYSPIENPFESPVKEIEEDSEEEVPALYYKDHIDLLALRSQQEDIKSLDKNIEALRSDIEIFQSQFDENIGIQTFTDEYIKECKEMSTDLEEIENDIEDLILERETETPVNQDLVSSATSNITHINSKLESISKNYEECHNQFLNFEESRVDVRKFWLKQI
jgi:DNA repair exonuclease SbcCD ATPase subunit